MHPPTIDEKSPSIQFPFPPPITGIYDFIGGGISNCICNAKCSSIVGGDRNVISGSNSSRYHFIGGGLINKICIPAGAATGDSVGFIGGGYNNHVTIGAGVIVGGTSNSNSGYEGFIGGGNANTVSGCYGFIGAGRLNTVSGHCGFIGGGCLNNICSGETFAVIGGGRQNIVDGDYSIIAGGYFNSVSIACSFIGGGCCHIISGDSTRYGDSILGGCYNRICGACYSYHNSILGGSNNVISPSYSANNSIIGGYQNTISGGFRSYSIIGNGYQNCISAGSCNGILGGFSNSLSHSHSFIIGCNLSSTTTNYTFMNNVCVSGTTRTVTLVETSAKKYKECIIPLSNQLENIKSLKPVQFTWKEDGKEDYGFIAEDVEKVFPKLVAYEEDGEISGVQYSKITSVLVKALQEQQDQIDELKAEVKLLKQNK